MVYPQTQLSIICDDYLRLRIYTPDDLYEYLKDKNIVRFDKKSAIYDFYGCNWIYKLIEQKKIKFVQRFLFQDYFVIIDNPILENRKLKLKNLK
jgi:hypothetical protein